MQTIDTVHTPCHGGGVDKSFDCRIGEYTLTLGTLGGKEAVGALALNRPV